MSRATRPRPAAEDADRYFFIHVQKTAGTTLRQHVLANFDRRQVYPPAGKGLLFRYVHGGLLAESSPSDLEAYRFFHGHFPFALHGRLATGGPLRTLTILREPVERTMSVLGQVLRRDPNFREATSEEVYDDPKVFKGQILNHQTKIFGMPEDTTRFHGFAPFVVGDAELERAKTNLASVDVVGLQSDFSGFLRDLSTTFGWSTLDGDVHENVGGAPEIDPALRSRIEADNAIDLEFYRYGVDLVARRRDNPAAG